ncbi:MAG: serine/threonine protein kinase [Bradymonadaceae bacterium]
MAICPRCHTKADELLGPCPTGDGYYCVEDKEVASYPDDPFLGRLIGGRFVVASVIGRGAMGYVYQAVQEQVDRLVALKIFRPETFMSMGLGSRSVDSFRDAAQERFVQEARVLGRLDHPNCVTLYDFGVSDEGNFLYIAMEHVGGISLRKAMRRGLKLEAIVEIIRQVLLALRDAHSLGIVHRDLKPENIMISVRKASQEQVVKVLDFGIAKLLEGNGAKTTAGLLFGTPAYMSPEQCRGETSLNAATDVYALGCLVYEMCSGHLPFEAVHPREMVRLHQEAPVPKLVPRTNIEVSDELEAFVKRCLSKDPTDRFPNAKVALEAFDEAVGRTAGAEGDRKAQRGGWDGTGKAKKKVVVPKNRVSGAELNPLPQVEAAVAEKPVKVVQQASSSFDDISSEGLMFVDTFTGQENTPAPTGRAHKESVSPGTMLVLGGLSVVTILCGLLFYFFYRMTLG